MKKWIVAEWKETENNFIEGDDKCRQSTFFLCALAACVKQTFLQMGFSLILHFTKICTLHSLVALWLVQQFVKSAYCMHKWIDAKILNAYARLSFLSCCCCCCVCMCMFTPENNLHFWYFNCCIYFATDICCQMPFIIMSSFGARNDGMMDGLTCLGSW